MKCVGSIQLNVTACKKAKKSWSLRKLLEGKGISKDALYNLKETNSRIIPIIIMKKKKPLKHNKTKQNNDNPWNGQIRI